MGAGSEGEEEFRLPPPLAPPTPTTTGSSSKRLKLYRKAFDDCNAVHPVASVPRKLRSVMNKRNRESISPPLPDAKKLQHTTNGMESLPINNKYGGSSDGSPRQSIPASTITKEEEEVVETLFALAGMFTSNNPVKSRGETTISVTKSSPLPETRENFMPASEVAEQKNIKSSNTSATVGATNLSSSLEGSPGETVKVKTLIEPPVLEWSTIPKSQTLDMVSKSSTAQVDFQNPLFSRNECTDITPLCDAAGVGDPSKLHPQTRLIQPKQLEALPPEGKQDNSPCLAAAVATKQEHHNPIKENDENGTHHELREGGPALWPGLLITGSSVGGVHDPSAQSSSTKAPAWLDSATCATRATSSGRGVLNDNIQGIKKVSPVKIDRRLPWKRCETHVHISRLIQAYRTTNEKGRLSVPPNLKPNEGIKSDAVVANDLTGVRNSLNDGVISMSSINGFTAGKDPNEARISILQGKRLPQDHQSSTTSGIYTSQKHSRDFLSLSTGSGGVENNNNNNQAGNRLEPSAQCHVPYMHSLVQHHPLMPFSFPQTYHSSPYPDQLTAAAAAQQVQLQLPQYAGSPFCGPPYLGHAGSVKQQQQQQQLQQQHHHMWAAQLAAQHKSGNIPGSQFPKWQTGRHDSPSLNPCGQTICPVSAPPEVIGTKFSPSAQQELIALSSSSRGKRHHHQIPGSYYGEGSSHLQLVYNAERL